ncbi:MAG: cobaltochelatase subunit CobN, partial [Thermoprotei archaeon]
MRIAVILGYGGSYIKTFSEVLGSLSSEYVIQHIITTDYEKPTRELVDFIKNSDVILLHTSTLHEEVIEAVKSSNARVVLSFSEVFQELSRGTQILAEAWRYFKLGGKENIRGLLELVLSYLGINVKPSPPKEIPWHGIWHPELGLYTSLRDYLKSYPYVNRPLVAVIFYRSRWLVGDTKIVEALVKTLESEGLGAVPIFTYGFRDYLLNTPTTEDTLREFLIADGKPIVDLVIVLTSFFILDHGKWHSSEYRERFNVIEGVKLLNTLNAPIIKPVIEHYESIDEWLKNPAGISPMTQVYHVIMPEV